MSNALHNDNLVSTHQLSFSDKIELLIKDFTTPPEHSESKFIGAVEMLISLRKRKLLLSDDELLNFLCRQYFEIKKEESLLRELIGKLLLDIIGDQFSIDLATNQSKHLLFKSLFKIRIFGFAFKTERTLIAALFQNPVMENYLAPAGRAAAAATSSLSDLMGSIPKAIFDSAEKLVDSLTKSLGSQGKNPPLGTNHHELHRSLESSLIGFNFDQLNVLNSEHFTNAESIRRHCSLGLKCANHAFNHFTKSLQEKPGSSSSADVNYAAFEDSILQSFAMTINDLHTTKEQLEAKDAEAKKAQEAQETKEAETKKAIEALEAKEAEKSKEIKTTRSGLFYQFSNLGPKRGRDEKNTPNSKPSKELKTQDTQRP
jgi:hypothetical protein